MSEKGTTWLKIAAAASFALAALHVVIIIAGAPAYLYFGAAELAPLAADGSPLPALITSVLVIIFAIFGLYALSGASVIRRLPLLTLGLIAIGSLYTLRGLILIPDLIRLARGAGYSLRQTVFSAVSLTVGLTYLAGVLQRRKKRG